MSMEKTLQDIGIADDVPLFNEKTKQMEKKQQHTNSLNTESLKADLKLHKGKTKYMTNHSASEDILIDQEKMDKVTKIKYLGHTTLLKDTTKEEVYARIRAAWSCFGKKQGYTSRQTTPRITQRTRNGPVCLATITYGGQTWSLNKQLINKLRTAQNAMERKM